MLPYEEAHLAALERPGCADESTTERARCWAVGELAILRECDTALEGTDETIKRDIERIAGALAGSGKLDASQ